MAITWAPADGNLLTVPKPSPVFDTITVTDPADVTGPPSLSVLSTTLPPSITFSINAATAVITVSGASNVLMPPPNGIKYLDGNTYGTTPTLTAVPKSADPYEWKPDPTLQKSYTITVRATSTSGTEDKVFTLIVTNNWTANKNDIVTLITKAY